MPAPVCATQAGSADSAVSEQKTVGGGYAVTGQVPGVGYATEYMMPQMRFRLRMPITYLPQETDICGSGDTAVYSDMTGEPLKDSIPPADLQAEEDCLKTAAAAYGSEQTITALWS